MRRIPPFAGQAGLEAWMRTVSEVVNGLAGVTETGVAAGVLSPFAGSVVPSGWLECDGSELLKSAYPGLYEAIGSTWGGTATTFFLPDGRGKGFIGRSDAYVLGSTGGADSVTLTTDELPAHTHGVTDPGHTHTFTGGSHTHSLTDPGHSHAAADGNFVLSTDGTGGAMADLTPSGSNEAVSVDDILGAAPNTATATTGISVGSSSVSGSIDTVATGVTVDSEGAGQSFSVMQPYFAGVWIIKT